MKKERFGFAAFDKESGKGLRVIFGMTAENRTSLTDDPEKVYVSESYNEIEIYTKWFNNKHKNKKDFRITEIKLTTEITPRWDKIKK